MLPKLTRAGCVVAVAMDGYRLFLELLASLASLAFSVPLMCASLTMRFNPFKYRANARALLADVNTNVDASAVVLMASRCTAAVTE